MFVSVQGQTYPFQKVLAASDSTLHKLHNVNSIMTNWGYIVAESESWAQSCEQNVINDERNGSPLVRTWLGKVTSRISMIQRYQTRVHDFNSPSTYSPSMLQEWAYTQNLLDMAGGHNDCAWLSKRYKKTALWILESANVWLFYPRQGTVFPRAKLYLCNIGTTS
jgi:hypothetical protein